MKRSVSNIFSLAVVLVALSAGCASLETAESTSKDSRGTWGEDLRALGGHGSSLGVSEDARKIESSLGF